MTGGPDVMMSDRRSILRSLSMQRCERSARANVRLLYFIDGQRSTYLQPKFRMLPFRYRLQCPKDGAVITVALAIAIEWSMGNILMIRWCTDPRRVP